MADKWLFCSVGGLGEDVSLQGVHEHGTMSSSGATRAEAFDRLAPGAVVLDIGHVVRGPDAIRAVLRAPLLDLNGAARSFASVLAEPGANLVAQGMVAAGSASGAFGTLIRGAVCGAVNLDSAGMDAYLAHWIGYGATVYVKGRDPLPVERAY